MQNLKNRTFQFALAIGRLVEKLPQNAINRAYINQLIRASSSVGANYRASQRAKSRADFLNKLKIVEEETDESLYFLELICHFNPSFKNEINLLIDEGLEILKIIVASVVTTRSKSS